MKIYNWRLYSTVAGRQMDKPPTGRTIIKVEPLKIEYRDLGLLAEGFLRVQTWEA